MPEMTQAKPKRSMQRARRATKEAILSTGVKLATQSYIHGIKEVYESKSVQARVFWIGLFTMCLAAATYEIYQVFHLWKDEGVATKISIETVSFMQYPTILFCPTNWLNKTKFEELKIDRAALQHLLSLLEPVSNFASFGYYWPSSEDKRLLTDAMAATGSHTIAEFMMKISVDKEAVTCSCCDQANVDKMVTKFGVCYVVDLCETPFQTHSVPSLQFLVDKNHSYQLEGSHSVQSAFVSLYQSRASIPFSTHDTVLVSANLPILIRLSLTYVKRISTSKKPCQDHDYSRVSTCELECYDRVENRRCRNCSMFAILEVEPDYVPCGKEHRIRGCAKKQKDEARTKFLECKKLCKPPCSEKIFNVATANTVAALAHWQNEKAAEDSIQVMFLFTSFSETLFEDVEIFNVDVFISSLGGQAGLWCGASIISIFHLISYCCCPCVHSIKAKASRKLSFKKGGFPEDEFETADEETETTSLNKKVKPNGKKDKSAKEIATPV